MDKRGVAAGGSAIAPPRGPRRGARSSSALGGAGGTPPRGPTAGGRGLSPLEPESGRAREERRGLPRKQHTLGPRPPPAPSLARGPRCPWLAEACRRAGPQRGGTAQSGNTPDAEKNEPRGPAFSPGRSPCRGCVREMCTVTHKSPRLAWLEANPNTGFDLERVTTEGAGKRDGRATECVPVPVPVTVTVRLCASSRFFRCVLGDNNAGVDHHWCAQVAS